LRVARIRESFRRNIPSEPGDGVATTNQVLGLRLDHVEVEAQLHQGDFMVVRSMCADRQRQPVTIDNRHDFSHLYRVWSARRNMLLREVVPDAFPVLVA
jgi:hypothetical protein